MKNKVGELCSNDLLHGGYGQMKTRNSFDSDLSIICWEDIGHFISEGNVYNYIKEDSQL